MPKKSAPRKISNSQAHCDCWMHDWFYSLLIVLVGFVLLGVNFGLIDPAYIAYWPFILVIIGAKELLERH